jgi:hypothetical protein
MQLMQEQNQEGNRNQGKQSVDLEEDIKAEKH